MSRYIDADKLKEHYMWWGGGFTANCKDGQKEVKKIFDEIIDLQPTADVRENVRGEWIWNPDGMDWGIGAWVCSECGNKPGTWWENDKSIAPLRCSGSSYCPNCGADMRGEA